MNPLVPGLISAFEVSQRQRQHEHILRTSVTSPKDLSTLCPTPKRSTFVRHPSSSNSRAGSQWCRYSKHRKDPFKGHRARVLTFSNYTWREPPFARQPLVSRKHPYDFHDTLGDFDPSEDPDLLQPRRIEADPTPCSTNSPAAGSPFQSIPSARQTARVNSLTLREFDDEIGTRLFEEFLSESKQTLSTSLDPSTFRNFYF